MSRRQGVQVNAWTATAEALAPVEALALSDLQLTWSAAYVIRYEGGMYRALFLFDGTALLADSLAGLESAIRGHWSRTWSTR